MIYGIIPNARFIYIIIHPDKELCLKRIQERKNHPSINNKSDEDINKILTMFIEQYQPLTDNEKGTQIELKMTDPLTDPEKTVIYMDKEQAALFLIFMQNYHNFGFMTASGVWEMCGGNVTLNFDGAGVIKSIKKETYAHR